jgi:hypothetical protein
MEIGIDAYTVQLLRWLSICKLYRQISVGLSKSAAAECTLYRAASLQTSVHSTFHALLYTQHFKGMIDRSINLLIQMMSRHRRWKSPCRIEPDVAALKCYKAVLC